MAAGSKKCPLCNRKLVDVNGVPTCPDCGYRDPQSAKSSYNSTSAYGGNGSGQYTSSASQAGSSGTQGTQNPYARAAGESAGNYYNQGTQQRTAGYGANIPQEPVKKKKKDSNVGKILGITGSVALAIFIGVVAVIARSGMRDSMDALFDAASSETDPVKALEESFEAARSESIEIPANRTAGGKVEVYDVPQSEFLITLVQELFAKPVDQVSYEELCSIIYLDVYESEEDVDGLAVDVILSDETQESYVTDYTSIDTADLGCLEGLRFLYLEDESLDYGTDWHNLKELCYLKCDTPMAELPDYMDVSQLIYLGTGDTFGMSDLSIVSQYTALEELELEAGLLTSLKGLSGASSLRGLYIEDGDRITDFSELYNMPWLEALSIDSQGLKDIGFISGMDKLYSLSLEETEVKKLDALLDCADTLTELRLEENYQVEDISPVLACTGLERLSLWVQYDFDVPMEVPDLSAMPNLYSLSIENYDQYTNLPLLTGLTELTIRDGSSRDLNVFESLTNLTTLNLVDMSITNSKWIEYIAGMDNLEFLSLEDSYIWADISPLFGLANLQYLDLDGVTCGLDTGKLAGNDSLAYLNLTDTSVERLLPNGEWDYNGSDTELPMQEVLDALAPCLPALTRLYAPDHDLDNLDFVSNFPQLWLLDISDNYVTDLTPLKGLAELTILMCEDNPVQSTEGLEDVIIYQ